MKTDSLNASLPHQLDVYARFKQFYRGFHRDRLNELEAIYHQDAKFKDPLHELEGLSNIHAYFAALCENVESCRFSFLDEHLQDDKAYLKWDMFFQHPRLGPKTISVRGMSQLQFQGDRIAYHEDCYDLGSLVYEHIPLLGSAVRLIKHRVAKG